MKKSDILKFTDEECKQKLQKLKNTIKQNEKKLTQLDKQEDKIRQEKIDLQVVIQEDNLKIEAFNEEIERREQEKLNPEPPEYKEYIFSFDNMVEPKSEDEVSRDLVCMICSDLVNNPQECQTCQSLFCQNCCQEWKAKKNQCPINCEGPWELRGPHKTYKQQLSQLKFSCMFKDEGCKALIRTDTIEQHQRDCPQWKLMIDNYNKNMVIKGVYYFQTQDKEWIELDQENSDVFEEQFQKNKKKFKFQIKEYNYKIDLEKMVQINLQTNQQRKLQRKEILVKKEDNKNKKKQYNKLNDNHIIMGRKNYNEYDDDEEDEEEDYQEENDQDEEEEDEEDEDQPKEWCWQDKDGKFYPYKAKVAQNINYAYNLYLENKHQRKRETYRIRIGKQNFQLNFREETQFNEDTMKTCKIARL